MPFAEFKKNVNQKRGKKKEQKSLIGNPYYIIAVSVCVCLCAVSYTHLTLPTNREV